MSTIIEKFGRICVPLKKYVGVFELKDCLFSKSQFILTFDVDWVPDFIMEPVIKTLKTNKLKSTWFVTHQSDILDELQNDELFEFGIHPNFRNGSSHGDTPDQVLASMKRIVPRAQSVRSHGLLQSSDIL